MTGMCPKGDDPMTAYQNYRAINVTTNSTNALDELNGTFAITFDGMTFEFNANATAVSALLVVSVFVFSLLRRPPARQGSLSPRSSTRIVSCLIAFGFMVVCN